MDLKREIKLFWARYSDPIIFYSIVFIGVFLIVQGLNKWAIEQDKIEANGTVNKVTNEVINEVTNISTITKEEDNKNKKIINNFFNYCKEGKIEEAYNLISINCKNQKYPNIDLFKNLYYNKIFNKKRNIGIEIVEDNIYKIIFYEDMLETGKIEGREGITDYYKINTDVLGENLSLDINYRNNIE